MATPWKFARSVFYRRNSVKTFNLSTWYTFQSDCVKRDLRRTAAPAAAAHGNESANCADSFTNRRGGDVFNKRQQTDRVATRVGRD
jgi:hypothetical protein